MGIISSSIARKVAMALSALFLIVFLVIHLAVNITSLFSEDLFNQLSHFMGTNPLIQFALQPVLLFGVVFHFVMGFILEIKNISARNTKYVKYNGGANASWMSRNMIYSGGFILIFLAIHMFDFWAHEMQYKYIEVLEPNPTRYYEELKHAFAPIWRVAMYCLGFLFLSLHLLHGFQSAFQSVGFNNKYTSVVKGLGKFYAIIVPLTFAFIALFHHFNH
ncbi:MAG: succinate dehydrogenase cytochrome b subunit [Flavobacteriaceae bacterium]|nr:succinate dehydrogenase cytochrome b subunit [Flavobacteriaceae bacterium]